MDGQDKKIPLMGPSGLYYANPQESESLIGIGFKPASQEDIEFSSPTQKAIGAAEAVGRGVIPFFTAAELLAGAEPERIRQRKEISIGEDLADAAEFGSMVLGPGVVAKGLGVVGKLAGIPKALEMASAASKFGTKAGLAETLGNAVSDGIEGKIGKLASKYAVEGAAFGVMDSLDRALISPEPKDAMSVTADALSGGAIGLLTGAAGGALVGSARQMWQSKFGNKAARALEQIKADTASNPVSAPQMGAVSPPSGLGSQGAAKATSIQEIQGLAKKLGALPLEELPEKKSLMDAISKVQDDVKAVLPTEIHIQSYDNSVVRDKFRIAKEMGDETAQALLNYDQMIKKSMIEGMDNQIKALNPNPVIDKVKSGQKALTLISKTYSDKKNLLKQGFKQFDSAGINPVTYIGEITSTLENSVPGLSDYLTFDGVNGFVKLKKWEPTAPFTKKTHQAAQQIVEAMNKPDLTIGQLRNARSNLKTFINYVTGDAPTNTQVKNLRKGLMDVIQAQVEKIDNSLQVRELFKSYAINEQNIDELERILNGKIFGEGKVGREIAPEEVLRKLFTDTVSVKSAKQILGEKQFDLILGDYLAQRIDEFTDPARKTFSSARMNTFLSPRQKLPELEEAFKDKLGILEKIKAYNTIARIVPDAQSIQPSGNVRTALGAVRDIFKIKNINPMELLGTISDMAANKVEKEEVKAFLNQVLKGGGKEAKAFYKFLDSPAKVSAVAFQSMLDYMKYATRGHYLVIRAAKSVLDESTKMPVIEQSEKELEKFDRSVQAIEQKPELALNIGEEIPYYMPEQSGVLGLATGRVVGYLSQKRPGVFQTGPLNKPKTPSQQQLMDYRRTLQIASNPPYIFKLIKEGRLKSQDVIDLRTMYPEIYDKYALQLLDSLTEALNDNKIVPQKIRKSLSLFGSMPLDTTMQPQSIQNAQAVFQKNNVPPQQQLPQMAPKSSRKSQIPSLTETDSQRRMLNR